MRLFLGLSLASLLSAGCRGGPAAGAPAAPEDGPRAYVILWFDTEDYILPASDDAAKRQAWTLKPAILDRAG